MHLETEVEKQAATIKQQQEKAFEVQKMEAIGLLAGGIAHDFNNRLTVIRGYSELLSRNVKKNETASKWTANMMRAVDETSRMIKQLLSFSRKEMINPVVMNLNTVINERRAMLSLFAGGQVAFTTAMEPRLGNCLCDPGQVEQILLNLVANARDAMRDGGRLEIRTENVELDGDYVRTHPEVKAGPCITLTVTDTGEGMNAETMLHLFEPFFTTKERGRGTGLGLATVYGIVRQNGGCIDVESKPGKGAKFMVHFPRTDARVALREEEKAAPSLHGGGSTVLVVDDEPMICDIVREVLTSAGYRVLDAPGPAEAIQKSRSYPGTIHLLLCDVIMLDGGARTVESGITAQRRNIKTIYMSGYADDVIAKHGVLDKGKHFIAKPFNSETLLRKVSEVLAGEKPGPERGRPAPEDFPDLW